MRENQRVVEETLERGVSKPSSLITIYLIVVALALTILGLVMLYSAGVTARHGPDGLLTRQIMWVSLSLFVGVYAAFMNLDWLRKRIWWIFGLCMLGLAIDFDSGAGG